MLSGYLTAILNLIGHCSIKILVLVPLDHLPFYLEI